LVRTKKNESETCIWILLVRDIERFVDDLRKKEIFEHGYPCKIGPSIQIETWYDTKVPLRGTESM
jgi:hypothetical protein